MKKLSLYIAIILLSWSMALSQEENSNSSPLSLPQLTIVGNAKLNVRSASKQFPAAPKPLDQNELDSLNSFEKQQSLLLPVDMIKQELEEPEKYNGFFKGSFGRYSTPELKALYGFNYDEYNFLLGADLEMSSGHIDDSDYKKINLNFITDYLAPEKYWIFGGSKTRFEFKVKNNEYNLYALDSAWKRNVSLLHFSVDSKGRFESFDFETGVNFETLNLSQDLADTDENTLFAFISVKNDLNSYDLGGEANITIDNYNGTGQNFLELMASGTIPGEKATVDIKAGFQTATNSMDVNRTALYAELDAELRINQEFSLRAEVFSGMEKNSFKNLLFYSPYMNSKNSIDYEYQKARIKAALLWHPIKEISVMGGIMHKMSERMPFFNSDTAGLKMVYANGSVTQLFADAVWQASDNDKLTGSYKLNFFSLDDGLSASHKSLINLAVNYYRSLTENFGTNIGLSYVGERYADVLEDKKIDAYINLNLGADYKVSNAFSVFAKIDNLLNQNIYYWDGYKERSLFVKVGVIWQF